MSFYLWSGFASKFCDVSEFCDAQASLLSNCKLCLCCQLSWMSQHPGHAVSNLISDNSTFWHLCLSVSRFLLLWWHDHMQIRKKGVVSIYSSRVTLHLWSQDRNSRQEWKRNTWRNAAYWLASYGFFSLLFVYLGFFSFFFFFFFETGFLCVTTLNVLELSHSVDQASLELTEILLTLPPECWYLRPLPPPPS